MRCVARNVEEQDIKYGPKQKPNKTKKKRDDNQFANYKLIAIESSFLSDFKLTPASVLYFVIER